MFVAQLIHTVIMRNVNRVTFCAILFAMLLVQPLFGDNIFIKRMSDYEYNRSF